ncbi:MAG: S1C family serine protease, partial [Paracoccaceae bacterium]
MSRSARPLALHVLHGLAIGILWLALAMVAVTLPARAQTLNDPVDATRLNGDEKRILQAALSMSGSYLGLLDGDWGRGSERALSTYAAEREGRVNATYGTLAALLTEFGNEVAQNDWQMIYLESVDISYAHPLKLLLETPDDSVMAFDAADKSFSLTIDYSDRTGATAQHAYIFGQGVQSPAPYQNYSDERLISSVMLPGGVVAYMRSDWVGDGYVTFSLIAAEQHRNRLALIAGSLQRGRAEQFVLPTGGRLANILTKSAGMQVASIPDSNPFDGIDPGAAAGIDPNPAAGERVVVLPPTEGDPPLGDNGPEVTIDPGTLLTPPEGETEPFANEGSLEDQPEPPPGDWNRGNFSSSGTGFFINRDNIVTAAHVVEGCQRMELTDATVREVIRSEPDLDLAVLKVPGDGAVLFEPGESDVWLEISPELNARLGETVTALGFPYLGRFGQGLTVTGGNVSALPGGAFGDSQIMISAPVQPGNSGGPLLNGDGEVIGVVVARIDDIIVLEETGTLPQSMNFAVTNSELNDFLARAQVTFPPSDGQGFDLSRGVPEAVSAS